MKTQNQSKEHTTFRTYSALATALVVTAFMISIINSKSITNITSPKTTSSLDTSIKKSSASNTNELKEVLKTSSSSIQEKAEESKPKQISYTYPLKGDIIIKFSPTELIYDEILEQYRTSNGITMKTNSRDLNAMCDSKIILIESNNSSKSKIKLMTTDNHVIELSGYFNNFSKKEGDIILKGSKLCNINNTNENSYVEISISKDNTYIDPLKLINS